jgi:hypothetical protein
MGESAPATPEEIEMVERLPKRTGPKGKLLRVPVVALERMLEEARPAPRGST